MNKKIIAIAIATAMAAPVAMADIKVSGQMAGALVNSKVDTADDNGNSDTRLSDSRRIISEAGASKLQFDMTAGEIGYARGALQLTNGFEGASPTTRDIYFGIKGGWGEFQLGRMVGVAKNAEKDPYIATFLQVRGTSAAMATAYGSNGFVDSLVQYSNKFGGVELTVQMDPTDKAAHASNGSASTLTDGETYKQADGEGYIGIAVKGNAGPVALWATMNSYKNFQEDTTTTPDSQKSVTNSNTKIGASMKFGTVKVTAQAESNKYGSDDVSGGLAAYTGGTVNRQMLMADMGLGNGMSVNLALGNSSAVDGRTGKGTFSRIAFTKQLDKGVSVFAGYTVDDVKNRTSAAAAPVDVDGTGSKTTQLGLGLKVKF